MQHCLYICETKWLDPEPGANGYDEYEEDIETIAESVGFYKRCYDPPTEEKYLDMCREQRAPYRTSRNSMDDLITSLTRAGVLDRNAMHV